MLTPTSKAPDSQSNHHERQNRISQDKHPKDKTLPNGWGAFVWDITGCRWEKSKKWVGLA